jgi:NAD(P) transhydrogenase subunit alpha
LRQVRITVAAETREGETRVAVVPELVGKLTGLGYTVSVEPGAGTGALHPDEEYVAAGAEVVDEPWLDADVVVSVNPLDPAVVRRLAAGTATVSFLPVNQSLDLVTDLRDCGITAFAMELVPRISRAQSMDALSSQALVSGYRCAIVAAGLLRRFFPLNMTAAGTVPPREVVVLGAGVAGLQAIATAQAARRGGQGVRRPRRRRGGDPLDGRQAIELELETLEGAGGYAREMTEDRAARQRELLAPYIADADALITTRRRPRAAGATAGHRRDGRADAAGLGGGRPGGGVRRQRRGRAARPGGAPRPRAGVGRRQRSRADARTGPRGSTRRTSSTW